MSKSNTKLKKGAWVNVYEDPITCQKLEGRAKLITHQFTAQGIEHWVVAFQNELMFVDRAINPETALEVLG